MISCSLCSISDALLINERRAKGISSFDQESRVTYPNYARSSTIAFLSRASAVASDCRCAAHLGSGSLIAIAALLATPLSIREMVAVIPYRWLPVFKSTLTLLTIAHLTAAAHPSTKVNTRRESQCDESDDVMPTWLYDGIYFRVYFNGVHFSED